MPTLKHNCPTCGKTAKVQSQFPLGNKINYVYQCGHLELREPYGVDNFEEQKEPLIALFQESLKGRAGVNGNGHGATTSIDDTPTVPGSLEPSQLTLPMSTPYQPNGASYDLDAALAAWDVDGGFNELNYDPTFASVDGSLYAHPFQIDGVNFIEKSRCRCIVGDAMGLGKTIQALLTLKRNHVLFPTLVVCPGSIQFQWAEQYNIWVSKLPFDVMPIITRDHIIPGAKLYIISMDLLSRKGVLELISKLGIRCVIADEVHKFKDPASQRTKALIQFIQDNNINHFMGLSGTLIKNRADELFTPLNIVDPLTFPYRESFRREWLTQNDKGVYTRLNPVYADEFKRLTSKYIIRREKHEVLKNLPPLTRDWQLVEIEDPAIKKSYNSTLDLFSNFLKNEAKLDSKDVLGWLAKLRAITGLAKCPMALEWILDFLDSTDESLAIGIQHNSVRETLYHTLNAKKLNPLQLSGRDDVYAKNRIQRAFNEGRNRVLVINEMAGGVGLNLQSCANTLVLERQWSPADEEQFESRFHRDGQKLAVTATYMIAKGTIDEFFHNMVYSKASILADTGHGLEREESDSLSYLKEFAEYVISHRL